MVVMKILADYDMVGVDQGVIYAAFNAMNVTTRMQTYRADGRYNEWFTLGYYARDAAAARLTTVRTTTPALQTTSLPISSTRVVPKQ
jgi:hypothetical protein